MGTTPTHDMNEEQRERLVGDPSDYGGRTLDEEQRKNDDRERTADGEPLNERGTADSAISHDNRESTEKDGRGERQ